MKDKLPETEAVCLLDLQELPPEIFQASAYATKPKAFDAFQEKVVSAKGIISILPEYNGSAPGIYKYFIDMLPFPESLRHTPSFFVGVSAGRFGSLRSIEQMQQVFNYRNAFNYPESTYIMDVGNQLNDDGQPTDQSVLKMLQQSLDDFIDFASKLH